MVEGEGGRPAGERELCEGLAKREGLVAQALPLIGCTKNLGNGTAVQNAILKAGWTVRTPAY